MSFALKGYQRDKEVLRGIEDWKAMNSQQAGLMFFPIKCYQRKAQQRLLKLFKSGLVKRCIGDDGYLYYLDKKPGQEKHLEALNWVRVWLNKKRKTWERVHYFQYEQKYGILQCDAFVAIKNTWEGQERYYFDFIELDRTHSNAFDKVVKYNKLFEEQNKYCSERWWFKLAKEFPTILIVTTTKQRKEKILQHIKEENVNNLKFDVRLLDDIKKECVK